MSSDSVKSKTGPPPHIESSDQHPSKSQKYTNSMPREAQSQKPPQSSSQSNSQMKPIQLNPKPKKAPNGRRSSKPIINWFQRKLAGTVKMKRTENVVPQGGENGRGKPATLRAGQRVTSSPLPSAAVAGGRQQGKLGAVAKRKTISLNDEDDGREYLPHTDDEELVSLDRSSTWSPNSAQLEADEDASVRPIPPSSPPSPSPSRSSSSYLSDPRTFRSIAASTKPTTLLSIDLNGGGMAHIAQVPSTAPSQVTRFPHIRTSSTATGPPLSTGTSITFSALPPSPSNQSRPSSLQIPASITQQSSLTSGPFVHAPLHTAHHPRNNPRPSSPPLDNASVLTLASSAYAIPGLRPGIGTSAPPSAVLGGGDSLSHFGGGGSMAFADAESTSQFNLGDDERLEERDVDASVRALRPRSSRRGSWESEVSRWSARIHPGPGTPSLVRERSVWTTNSARTGTFSVDNMERDEGLDDHVEKDEELRKDEPLSSDLEPPVSPPIATSNASAVPTELVQPPEALDDSSLAERGPEVTNEGPVVNSTPAVHHQSSASTVAQISSEPHDVPETAHNPSPTSQRV